MLPVIALVGRPNVGKSTLFNCLTRTRDALVADQPGLTRDRQYGVGKTGDYDYLVLDTGGLSGTDEVIDKMIASQVWKAIEEADLILFIVDGRTGINTFDYEIANQLRRTNKPVIVTVNKTEGRDEELILSDFFELGLGTPTAISAAHQRGISDLIHLAFSHALIAFNQHTTTKNNKIASEQIDFIEDELNSTLPTDQESADDLTTQTIRLAIIGRPNVGKSTFINRLLGEERVLSCDMPGTTRDAIEIPFSKYERNFVLIDTAGIRRRARIDDRVEKFSVLKSLQALEKSNVVVFMFDAKTEISDQDAHLIGHILDSGRAFLLVINKWDGMTSSERDWITQELARKFSYIDFTSPLFISALHGTNVPYVIQEAIKAYDSAMRRYTTNELTNILQAAIVNHHPPIIKGLAPKLRYAHQGGKNPPRFIIHGNRVDHVSDSYRRYLINYFRQALNIQGTPIQIQFRAGDNPYQEKAQNKAKPAAQHNKRKPRKTR